MEGNTLVRRVRLTGAAAMHRRRERPALTRGGICGKKMRPPAGNAGGS